MEQDKQSQKLNTIARLLNMKMDHTHNKNENDRRKRDEKEQIEPDCSLEQLRQDIEHFELGVMQDFPIQSLQLLPIPQLNQYEMWPKTEQSVVLNEDLLLPEEPLQPFFQWVSRFISKLQYRIQNLHVEKRKPRNQVKKFISLFKRGNNLFLIASFEQHEDRFLLVRIKEAKKYFSRQLNVFFRHFQANLNEKVLEGQTIDDSKAKVESLAEMLGYWWRVMYDPKSEDDYCQVVRKAQHEPTFEQMRDFLYIQSRRL